MFSARKFEYFEDSILKYHILLVSVSFLLKRISKRVRILKYDISKLNIKLYFILKHHILLISVSCLLKRSRVEWPNMEYHFYFY
jgi:hypothetical protein